MPGWQESSCCTNQPMGVRGASESSCPSQREPLTVSLRLQFRSNLVLESFSANSAVHLLHLGDWANERRPVFDSPLSQRLLRPKGQPPTKWIRCFLRSQWHHRAANAVQSSRVPRETCYTHKAEYAVLAKRPTRTELAGSVATAQEQGSYFIL